MFTRELPKQTLTDVRNQLDVKSEWTTIPTDSIKLNLTDPTGHPTIRFGRGARGKPYEVPSTQTGLVAIGNILDVPSPFLKRIDAELKQSILEHLLKRAPGEVLVRFTDEELIEVQGVTALIIDPRRLVDSAIKVIDPKALVVEVWNEPGLTFRCDVIVPDGFDKGIGGDRPRKGAKRVGDITKGGLRFGVDHKHHLAPWVSQYLFRLICTNGQEREDPVWRVEARGQTVEQVMAEFEAQADRAFKSVEHTIGAFYDLRNTKVENPERTLNRIAREQKLPDRVRTRLIDMAASEDIPDNPTMFDIVNVVTNQANDPVIATKPDVRRVFEVTGGAVVSDHAARCGHCLAKLN